MTSAEQCFCLLFFLPYTSGPFPILENEQIGCFSDDRSLLRHLQALELGLHSLFNSDLGKVSEWCDVRGMKLNASKIMFMIVSR